MLTESFNLILIIMTAKELNRDIKRLAKDFNTDKAQLPEFEKEFKRLYWADDKFEYANLFSLKAMLRINSRHRFIALHQFGLNINLNE